MSVKAYKVEKLAKEPSFKPNDLIEYLFEDVDAIFNGVNGNYFVWLEKEDLDELEERLDEYKTGDFDEEDDEEEYDDEDEEDDEIMFDVEEKEIDFSEKDFRETETIIKKIKQDLDKDGSVKYLFQ